MAVSQAKKVRRYIAKNPKATRAEVIQALEGRGVEPSAVYTQMTAVEQNGKANGTATKKATPKRGRPALSLAVDLPKGDDVLEFKLLDANGVAGTLFVHSNGISFSKRKRSDRRISFESLDALIASGLLK